MRSQKHNNSSAFSHHQDLLRVLEIFPDAFKTPDGLFKPVLVKGTDGGPDENPRFEKNINMGCKTFKELQLDLYIEVTNAPGLSAYNKVERKMFHLSKELTGVVLPPDTYGSHLDSSGKTIDSDLEEKNFEAAGQTLCSLWNDLEIDGYPTIAEYIKDPPVKEITEFVPSPVFRSKHVLETQYMVIYMKCDNRECCDKFKTNVDAFFPHRRVPPLIPITHSDSGIEALDLNHNIEKVKFPSLSERVVFEKKLVNLQVREKFGRTVPYDVYLPTVKDKIEKRICKKCGKYHASIKSLGVHNKVCKKSKNNNSPRDLIDSDSDEDRDVNLLSEEEIDEHEQVTNLVKGRVQYSVVIPGEFVEKILDLKEWLKSPWVTDDNNNDDM